MEHLDKSLVGVERLGENQELQARFCKKEPIIQNPLLIDSIYNGFLPFFHITVLSILDHFL